MKFNELKTIVNHIEMDDNIDAVVKIMYGDKSGYCVTDIKSFCIMNGRLVFTVDPDIPPVVKMY